MRTRLTLTIVHRGDQVLLGYKKRGFGAGRWNGFGGKIEEGEGIIEAAKRELLEECGLEATNMAPHGQILFSFENEAREMEVHLFRVGEFSGNEIETEEMRPQWFSANELPYDKMWSDDRHWLPLVLAGNKINARFHFDSSDNQQILNQEITIL